MKTMVGEPSRSAPGLDVVLGGLDFRGDTGAARLLGDVPFNVFARVISSARVNLNITEAPARDRARLLDGATVRARVVRCRDRLEPACRHRPLVRAGRRARGGGDRGGGRGGIASLSPTPARPRRWGAGPGAS